MSGGRGGKGQARRPNRSQARAIEARARTLPAPETTAAPVADEMPATAAPVLTEASAPAAPTLRSALPRAGQRARSASRPVVLSRQQEYAFIRADLRRLLMTASLLVLAMLVLLVVIEL